MKTRGAFKDASGSLFRRSDEVHGRCAAILLLLASVPVGFVKQDHKPQGHLWTARALPERPCACSKVSSG